MKHITPALVLSVVASTACLADTQKLSVTADVGICAHPREVELNTGGAARVRVKGNEHYYLFRFDAAAIRNWRVTAAALHVKLAAGHLRRVAFCSVPPTAGWTEGTSRGRPQDGSSCFTCPRYPAARWTSWGGTMMDATFNNPHMLWLAGDVKAGADGWLEIPIDPRLVMACAAGLSDGLVLAEEKGQTRENHDIYTREQSNARPYVTVQGEAIHVAGALANGRPAPKVEALPAAASFQHGAVRVDTSWPNAPGPVVGSIVRPGTWDVPLPPVVTLGESAIVMDARGQGLQVESYIGPQGYSSPLVKLADSPALEIPAAKAPPVVETTPAVVVDKASGWRVELHPLTECVAPDAKPLPDGATVPMPVTPRNAWVGFSVVLSPPNGQASNVTIEAPLPQYAGQADVLPTPVPVRVCRAWYIPDPASRNLPEALVPLGVGEKFDIPWKANALATQRNQLVCVEFFMPRQAHVGPWEGKLTIKQAGAEKVAVPIRFGVAAVTLGDEFRIVGDMNTYGSPAGAMGARTDDPKAYMEMERKYYRLAHAHRMTLSALPYTQSGSVNWRGAPKIGDGGKLDWSEWDERYGPLLSGEAFSPAAGYVGPGANTPIHHTYLPFHENWPAPLEGHFKPWPPPKDYDAFLKWSADLPAIAQCFGGGDSSYAANWHRVLRESQRHLAQRGWGRTQYQVYLNNKHYFRNPKESSGRGISLWLLDEPMFADDFLALRYYGMLARGMAVSDQGGAMEFRFRIDISRPTHQRNWLDGLVDLNVCAGQLYQQRHLIARRKRQFGEEYWNYQMPPSFTGDNAAWAIWPVWSYCWGATGTLPWQTIGSDGDLDKADETALMYPGRRFGLEEPLPSLRMKAWREGLQVAELLRMLRDQRQWNDVQLRAWVGQVLNLDGWKDGIDPKPEAGIVTFKGVGWNELEILKRAMVECLNPQ